MDCSEFKKNIADFASGKLDLDTNRACLSHIKECKDCLDELEIYCIVEYGINNVDDNAGPFSLDSQMKLIIDKVNSSISKEKHRIKIHRFINTVIQFLLFILVIVLITLLFNYF